MSDDVLEFRVESLEEDVKDLKTLSAQIVKAQSKAEARLAGLEGELRIQNKVLQEGFDLIKKVMLTGIGFISIVITGSQMVI
jgi:TolA-binding protein